MIFSKVETIDGEQYVNIDLLIAEQKENTMLKDNWNKLKEWLEERKKYYEIIGYVNTKIAFEIVLEKLQEIEGGMNE